MSQQVLPRAVDSTADVEQRNFHGGLISYRPPNRSAPRSRRRRRAHPGSAQSRRAAPHTRLAVGIKYPQTHSALKGWALSVKPQMLLTAAGSPRGPARVCLVDASVQRGRCELRALCAGRQIGAGLDLCGGRGLLVLRSLQHRRRERRRSRNTLFTLASWGGVNGVTDYNTYCMPWWPGEPWKRLGYMLT